MANLSVALMIRYKDAVGKWRRSPAARGKNGRVRPGHAQVRDQQVAVEPYTYDLRVHEGRVSKYIPVGTNAAEADAERLRREKRATAVAVAADAGLKIEIDDARETLLKASGRYVADAEARGAKEAAMQARLVLNEFQTISRRIYVDEIVREDVLRFHEALRKRGCAPRTVANKHNRLKSFLLFAKADAGIIPPEPRYDVELPTMYSREQIASILQAADPYMRLVVSLALKCGLRDQEIVHLEWRDIDWHDAVLRVRSKPVYGFRVKDSEERDIPVQDDLLVELGAWRTKHEKSVLALGTKSDKPNRHLLRVLKSLAKKAGLNCGHCEACASSGQCEQWTLHKFRRTYCTTLLRSGIDLRTAQAFMGHADMASTMRYLRPASSMEVRSKVNAVDFG
ncbi:tyrosine-type recombinase/integrase [Telmatobacter bradus]|uniref:tyrosine-type recombinase/integrase n=1 Tax=Telmatobacter bradus TaxID=474953 RepID=UPI003B42BCBA